MSGHEPVGNGRRATRLAGSLAALGLVTAGVVVIPAGPATAADPPAPTNAIVAENALPGATDWDVAGAGDPTIQGFTTDISANLGDTVQFKIDTTAAAYDIKIYRLGYYGGDGARLVHTIPAVTGTDQPECLTSAIPMGGGAITSGALLDCGNWTVSASWQVPADATSGVYIARPTRTDDGGASHIPFIVRDDSSTSNLLFQTSDTTWQSYNTYGGYNAYGSSGATMAEKLSYNRPFATRGAELENYLFNAEYPMIRWLERNGYDVSYMSAIDTERHANLITNHDIFLSVGHDEYWSQGRRDAVTAARDAGVHLAFFSGNEVYWKTRWEPSTADGGSTDYRTQVVYKEGNTAPSGSAEHRNCYNNFDCDPSPIWTGQWRQAPGATPENSLSGQISWRNDSGSITVPSEYAPLRFWRDTDVAALAPGGTVTLADGTLGYEWDPEYPEYAASYPAGRVLLSTTDVTSFVGPEQHHLSLYRAPSGALVFGAGTVQWAWGLDSNHDRGSAPEDPNVQQATVNLFADMGVQPASLQSNLVAATPSSDTTPPVVTVTSPAAGTTVPGGSVTVTGTASDAGGAVGAIEVSTNGGTTWQRATGRADWSYTYAATEGPANVQVRATDDSINLATPITHTFTVAARECPCSIFPDNITPAAQNSNDGQAIEVGTKFRAAQDGYVTDLRYYWTPGDTGTHTGNLWTATGQLLATAVFPTPTTAGWQSVALGAPVPVAAGTTYVASQHSSAGYYPANYSYFTTALENPPLTALADGTDGPNGVYRYGASAFPTASFQASNHWVDVVFATEVGPDTSPPTIVGRTPAPNATGVAASTDIAVTFSEPVNADTLTDNVVLRDADGATVAGTLAYNETSRTATLDPSASLAAGATYTVVVVGGEAGVTDLAGNRLAANASWQFTVATPTPPRPDPTVGPGGPVLVVDGTGQFGSYLPEIMRAEGLNLFTVGGVGALDASGLAPYRTVILGETTLTSPQVTALTDWVQAGGNLVAMRPDPALAGLLGLTAGSGTLAEGYLRVDTTTTPGAGIVAETMQFHGVADRYSANAGTQVVATLYSDASTTTSNPAVTLREVGTEGGSAAAFTYDLARSVVLTRQGNPAWADINGDGSDGPVRADDLFHNATENWVDLDKVPIPQADEQQRLLANILTLSTADALPLPRFWYLPRDEVAAVVMTADEHNGGNVRARLDAEGAVSPAGCSVNDWDCIRSTSYLYPDYPSMSVAEATAYEDAGFEIALHPNTGCANPDRQLFTNLLTNQLAALEIRYPGLSPSSTSRIHCIAWTGYTTIPEVLAEQGIHLDTNYYYWPAAWLNNRPGMFTGSGFPQRFSTESGDLIDVYQATTQFTDESGQSFPTTVTALMDAAIGPQGYYGAFVGNFHTDGAGNSYYGPVVAAAQARGVPVISAKQLMTWTDGRNASSFADLTRVGNVVTFSVAPGAGANGLRAMLPVRGAGGTLQTLSRGEPVAYDTRTIKGLEYAVFDATAGTYTATYDADVTAPVISAVEAAPGAGGTATIRWTTSEPATSRVDYGTTATALDAHVAESVLTTTHEVELTGLAATTTYYFRVTSTDGAGNTSVLPAPPADPASFIMPTAVAVDTTVANFTAGATGSTTYVADTAGGEVMLSPTVGAEFSGTALPSEWATGAWTGGTATVAGGALEVDGAFARTTALYDPNRALEFRATFGNTTYTNAGLAFDFDTTERWAAFGVGNLPGQLYARVANGSPSVDVPLGGGYIGSPHTYRIEWTDTQVRFLIDGELVHTSALAIAGQMRPIVSDYNAGGPAVSVDWLRMTPYASAGTFTSRILGSEGAGSDWGSFSYVADVPAVTTLTFDVRTGDVPTPDGSWTEWAPISQGDDVTTSGRYLQYRATATGDGEATPVLQSVTLPYTSAADADPPAISDRSPAPGATGVGVDSDVTASFDEPMDPATITSSTVTLRAAGAASDVPATVTYSGVTATLNPAADLAAGTTYTVTVAASVTDLAGNPLGTVDTWTFTTAAGPDPSDPDAAIHAYITKVYNDLFHRNPDPTGLAGWTNALKSGTPYGQVANGITYSDEYRSKMIRATYQTYLGRAAEPAGLAGWLAAMRSGMHIEEMQGGFISSPEFYARYGSNDRGWITGLYQTVLGRNPASSEVDSWQGVIGAGYSRYQVALGFLYSTEHLTAVVDGYYVDLLGRHIDPSGQATWVGLIQRGHRDEEIIALIVSSVEYRAKV